MNRNELAKLVKKPPGLRKLMAEAALPPSVINRLIAEEVMEEAPENTLSNKLTQKLKGVGDKEEQKKIIEVLKSAEK